MASEIRVDKITSLSGVGTITPSSSGIDITGITTVATLKATTGIVTTLTAVSSAKVGSGVTLSPDGDIFATGVTTATTFVGALTGNVTGNTSGTAGGLTGTPNISCGTIAGSTGTFSGDVNVGAGITLDASAGIVTAANEVSAGRISMLTVDTGGRLVTSGAFLTIQAATGTVIEDLDGNNQIKGNDGGSVQLYHNGTEQCYTSSSGLAFPSGKGIDFSATSGSPSNGGELLDDYEEGDFTPYLGGQTNYSSYNITGNGHYVKIGKVVHVNIQFNNKDLNDSASGRVMIYNLPFAPFITSGNARGVSTNYMSYNVTHDSNGFQHSWFVDDTYGSFMGLITKSNTDWDNWGASNFTASSMYLDFQGTYFTAA